MKVSTRGRYGLRAMVELAYLSADGCCVSLKTMAASQNVSENYLEQIFSQLRKSDLVKSIRGAGGGYMLMRAPYEISVGDILRVLEGDLSPAACAGGGAELCLGGTCECCTTKGVWEKIFTSVNDVVDSITLNDLIAERLSDANKHDE